MNVDLNQERTQEQILGKDLIIAHSKWDLQTT